VRGDVPALLEAIGTLRKNDSSSENEGSIAITTAVPGLREAILRHAGDREIQQRENHRKWTELVTVELRMRNIHQRCFRNFHVDLL